MPRGLFVCTTIVAAFQLHLAAASSIVEDALVTLPVAALASRLGVDPSRDRAQFLATLVRELYANLEARPPSFPATRPVATPGAPVARPIMVPVPLPATVWSAAVFHQRVAPDQLIATILSDRHAALLCRGLSGLDDETLTYLVEHPAIVTLLYERGASTFGAFGDTLRIHGGRVVPPGGDASAPLWEAVALAPLGQPELFVRALFVEFDGRLAYLFDVVTSASPDAARFALGAWLPDASQRLSRFKALFDATARSYREWNPADHPFARPLGDLATLLLRIKVSASGEPLAPASRAFWSGAFEVGAGEPGAPETIDAAWLVSVSGGDDMYSRVDRLDQFAFGQRVFSGLDSSTTGQAADVLRSFRRHRMLLLTLDRMGVRTPAVYVVAAARAAAMADLGGSRRFWTVAQFQGALAFVARLRRSGAIDRDRAETLARSVASLPLQEGEYLGRVARWWRNVLAPALPPAGTWELRAIAALAGPAPAAAQSFVWEGETYRIDLAAAERQRMEMVRRKQGGPTLDLALAIDDLARQLLNPTLTLADLRVVEQRLGGIAAESAVSLRHPAVNLMPPGVAPRRDALTWVRDALAELSKLTRASDIRRASRIGASLQELADAMLGETLLSFAYAAEMGDPDGAALLAGNVALRHDFGFGRKDNEGRMRMLWAQPRQDFSPGVPWHVTGSLLGLDIALAQLSLRRLSIDGLTDPPRLSSIEREALAVTVVLLEPARMTDHDRDAIASAIGRGKARVAALAAGTASSDQVVADIGMDGRRRRSLNWALQSDPSTVAAQFSLGDLITLGGGAEAADLDAWGTPALHSFGCACTRFVGSRVWRVLDGRSQLPMLAATMGDLNLAIALVLRDLNLPAALTRSVLSLGMQDIIDSLGQNGDWWGLSRAAQTLRRQRVEDYVSAAAAVGGPLVPVENETPSRIH